MNKILSVEQACRALAEKFPEKFEYYYYGLNEGSLFLLRIAEDEHCRFYVLDMCACDFDSILEGEGLEIEVKRRFNDTDRSVIFDALVFPKNSNICVALITKVGLKKEASSAAFMAAVEWLVNQEKE